MQQPKPIELHPAFLLKSDSHQALDRGNVSVLEQSEALAEAAQRWDLLRNSADMPTHQMAWLLSCLHSFGPVEKPMWIVVGGEQPRAIAPLAQRGRLSRLVTAGVDELYEPTAFPSIDKGSLEELVKAVVKLRRPLFLKRVLADSPLIPALKEAYGVGGLVYTRPVAGCPSITLDECWLEPELMLSAGRRSSIRRAQRHAESLGKVEWEFCRGDRASLVRGLNEAFRIESAGWKGRTGTALLNDTRRRTFFETYVDLAAGNRSTRLSFLRIGGKAVAMQVAVECADRFWLLKVGYDEEYAHCSPGNLLMLETIRYAARHGLRSYEFLGTEEPWTANWTEQVRPCVSLLAYPFNVPGMAALAGDAFRVGLQRYRQHSSR